MKNKIKNKFRLLSVLLVPLISLFLNILTIKDYGINWDEPYHFRRGQAFLHFFLTGQKKYENMPQYPAQKGGPDTPGFRNSDKLFKKINDNPDLADPNYRRSYYQDDSWNGEYHIDLEDPAGHPALGSILASIFNKIFYQKLNLLGDLESYHLFEVFTASFLIFFIAIFMWKKFGIVQSVISSLAISTYPLFVGEQHFNIKDPIETTFYTLTLLTFYLSITRKKTLYFLISIISFAFGLSTKFNIVFILFPILIWLFFYLKKWGIPKLSKTFHILFLFSPILIVGIFIFLFPTLWKNPITGILKVINYYKEVGYATSQPPNYYLFKFLNIYPALWIVITTPLTTLILFVSVFFNFKIFKKGDYLPLLLALSFFTTLARISLFGALSYGGVRIIMEFIPIVAMLAGIAAGEIYKKLNLKLGKIFLTGVIISYGFLVGRLAAIHPNENVFFNSLIGGLKGAQEKKISFWGNSNGNAYFPAINWLNKNAEKNAKLAIPIGSITNIPRFKLRPDIALSWNYWSGPENKGEYVVELTYDYEPMKWFSLNYLNTALTPLYEVKVDGVPIAKVWKNSPEFVKPEYQRKKMVSGTVKANRESGYIEIDFSKKIKILKITLLQPIKNCSATTTGYVLTTANGEDWLKETEDIARDQLKHAQLKKLVPNFEYYFTFKDIFKVRFYPQNNDSCLFYAQKAQAVIVY